VLTPAREDQLKAAYRRHAVKTIVTARHVVGLRAAAFLTAGIAHVPFVRFLVIDTAAALVSVPIMFGLAYFFTDRLQEVLADVRRLEGWLALLAVVAIAIGFVVVAWWRQRRGVSD
jgi:membrane protein DedA with SNARE-associated domain